MGFEYDKAKSRANQRGYGIDFEREQTLWEDLDRVEIPARTVDEPRFSWLWRRPVASVNVDFPVWTIVSLDKEARRLGVPRQSIIKVWVAERLERAGYLSS